MKPWREMKANIGTEYNDDSYWPIYDILYCESAKLTGKSLREYN